MLCRRQKSATDYALVLDLDETLLHTIEEQYGNTKYKSMGLDRDICYRERCYQFPLDDRDSVQKNRGLSQVIGVLRPYCKEFLRFCFQYFRVVCVWSAGTTNYVDHIVENLFADCPYPDLVWTRTECESENGETKKPLEKMIKAHPELHLSLDRMLILDDNLGTASFNPGNIVHIPKFTATTIKSMEIQDQCLVQFAKWLQTSEVLNAKDIRKVDKSTIFSN